MICEKTSLPVFIRLTLLPGCGTSMAETGFLFQIDDRHLLTIVTLITKSYT